MIPNRLIRRERQKKNSWRRKTAVNGGGGGPAAVFFMKDTKTLGKYSLTKKDFTQLSLKLRE